ncbi:helix-turn-helix domain-containing protein [Variovorax boronicumulans]|uniref:helix-turn-helix domain-containing protein n=1 Tax=Variovorax boronicumulans TaxID=436515 RepID=UPI001C57DD7C
MIRFRLKERIADLSFRTGRRVTLDEVAAGTGIHRATLSKLGSKHGYNSSTDVLDKLCEFFGCRLEEIAEHVPESPSALPE